MTKPQKTMTIGAVGMLLGFGLCGLDRLIPHSRAEEFGGSTALWGAAVIAIAALLLVGSLLAMAVQGLVTLYRRRR